MKSLKLSMSALLLLFVIVVVTACGGTAQNTSNPSNNQPSAPSTPASQPEASSEPIEIKFLHVFGGSQGEAIQEIVSAYNASQDQVVVTAEMVQGFYNGLLERLQTLAVSDQLPEVAIGSYANAEIMNTRLPIRSVQQFMDAESFDASDFNQTMFQLGLDQQQVQQNVPFAVSTPLIYVNLDHFKEAGIEYTQQPASWEEVREWAKILSDRTADRSGIFFQMDFDTWMFQTLLESKGGAFASLENEEVTFNSELGKEVLNYWLDMVNIDQSYPRMDGNQAAHAFQNGELSMIVATTGNLNSLTGNVPFELGTMLLPTWENNDAPRRLPAGGAGLYIFQSDEQTEAAAWDFVKFATSTEGSAILAEKMGYMALRESSKDLLTSYFESNPMAESSYLQSDDIVSWFVWPGDSAARANSVLLSHIQGAFAGEMDADQALDQAAEEINRILGW